MRAEYHEGSSACPVCVGARDDSQRLDQLHAAMCSLEAFNRSVSHDLRGPLGSIRSLADIAVQALDQRDVPRARQMVTLIAGQALRCNELVATLLRLAHLERDPLEPGPVDLHELVDALVDELRCMPRTVAWPRFELDDLPSLCTDRQFVATALRNLLVNAVKFTDGMDDACVRISGHRTGGKVVLHVDDNGIGFPQAQAHRLFQPFSRLHAATHDGHGLGLSIVRTAVERLGGQVRASRSAAGGARFSIELPDLAAADVHPVIPGSTAVRSPPGGGTARAGR